MAAWAEFTQKKLPAIRTRWAAALWIHAKIIHRRRHFGTVRKGMDNLCTQLEKLARGESVSAEHAALPSMMIRMTQVIYGSRGYTYLANATAR